MARRSIGRGQRFKMEVTFSSDVPQGIRKLQKIVQEQVTRSGAYAGAEVFYNEMHRNVPVATGKLYGAIYHWHDDKQSGPLQQVYAIGPNKREAPHWYNVEFGHWRYNRFNVEGGHWERSKSNPNGRVTVPGAAGSPHDLGGALATPVWVPAIPYGRQTWDNVKNVAVARMRVRMGERLQELIG